jgi:hypothetical protein
MNSFIKSIIFGVMIALPVNLVICEFFKFGFITSGISGFICGFVYTSIGNMILTHKE